MTVVDCHEAGCPGAEDAIRCAAIRDCPICAAEVCNLTKKLKGER